MADIYSLVAAYRGRTRSYYCAIFGIFREIRAMMQFITLREYLMIGARKDGERGVSSAIFNHMIQSEDCSSNSQIRKHPIPERVLCLYTVAKKMGGETRYKSLGQLIIIKFGNVFFPQSTILTSILLKV